VDINNTPEEHVLVGFVSWLAGYPRSTRGEGLAPSTIRGYLSAIRSAYVSIGRPNPLEDTPFLEKVLRGIKRLKTNPTRPRLPVTTQLLGMILRILDLRIDDHLVFWSIATLGVLGVMRLGEVLGNNKGAEPLLRSDLHFISDTHVQVKLRASKTDPFRKGVDINVFATDSPVCAVTALTNYLRNRNFPKPESNATTPLFTRSNGKAANKEWFVRIMQLLISEINTRFNLGLNATHFTGHSLRSGGASSLAQAGAPEYVIATMGRWRSDCYKTYIKLSLNVVKSSMIRVGALAMENHSGAEVTAAIVQSQQYYVPFRDRASDLPSL
jgi:integrase